MEKEIEMIITSSFSTRNRAYSRQLILKVQIHGAYIEGTVIQMEKALINYYLRISKVS